MDLYEITYWPINTHGTKLGGCPVCLLFYANTDFDTDSLCFKRMLVEYARVVGRRCSNIQIVTIKSHCADPGD